MTPKQFYDNDYLLSANEKLHYIATSSSAITERPCCRVGYLWPKVEDELGDNILRTL